MPALSQFAVIALSWISILGTALWAISHDRQQSTPEKPLLIAAGRRFHRVPVRNLHRLHGRHRA